MDELDDKNAWFQQDGATALIVQVAVSDTCILRRIHSTITDVVIQSVIEGINVVPAICEFIILTKHVSVLIIQNEQLLLWKTLHIHKLL